MKGVIDIAWLDEQIKKYEQLAENTKSDIFRAPHVARANILKEVKAQLSPIKEYIQESFIEGFHAPNNSWIDVDAAFNDYLKRNE